MDYGKEINNILDKYRADVYQHLMRNVASDVYETVTKLQGVKHFTYDGFKEFYTESVHGEMVKLVAYKRISSVSCKRSSWSGGHSVTNMLEQAYQDVFFNFFEHFRIYESFGDMKEYILACIREREQKKG